jgi:hypothetical protein
MRLDYQMCGSCGDFIPSGCCPPFFASDLKIQAQAFKHFFANSARSV